MLRFAVLLLLPLILLSSKPNRLQAERFAVKPVNAAVGFSIQYLRFWTVRGCFNDITGDLVTSDGSTQLHAIEGDIKVDSIWTGIAYRDHHLMSENYFNVEQHPVIRFSSERVISVSDSQFKISGVITIKGISRPIEFQGEIEKAPLAEEMGEKTVYIATGIIDRRAFLIGPVESYYPENILISKEVIFQIVTQICIDALGNAITCPEESLDFSRFFTCKPPIVKEIIRDPETF